MEQYLEVLMVNRISCRDNVWPFIWTPFPFIASFIPDVFFPFLLLSFFYKTAKAAQFIPVCLSSAERWLKGINNHVFRWHTFCTLGLHFISTWKRERDRDKPTVFHPFLSLHACVFMCVYLCSYGSSEMIRDETLLPRNVNDPELVLCLYMLQCLNYFRVNF